jgi:triacylglycerol lipase
MRFKRTLAAAICAFGMGSNAFAQDTTPAGFTQTRFPVVLAEGLGGINFFMVAEQLRAGGATVFLTTLDNANTSIVRGQQLLTQINQIRAMTGSARVNLIGHSQGGLDARFVLGTQPQVLASITQAGTPNLGSAVANALAGSGLEGLLGGFLPLIGGEGGGTDPAAAVRFLTTAEGARFTEMFPAGVPTTMCGMGAPSANGVALFSFGGTTLNTNFADISDFLLSFLSIFFGIPGFGGEVNDGLVGQCSTHFGTVIRDNFVMNHIDLVNQVNGAVGMDNPIAVYRMQVNRLKNMGL